MAMTANPWSPAERQLAASLRAKGHTLAQIAEHLPGRTARAVKQRLALDRAPRPLTADRAINAEPWEPLGGFVKRQCAQCRFWFAAPANALDRIARCPDCALGRRERAAAKRRHRERASA